MKILIIGGTGLLGAVSARELIRRGHAVKSIALPPIPEQNIIPSEMEIITGNYTEMSNEELKSHIDGCNAFVFAAGVDERVEFPAPVLDHYIKYNVDPLRRLLEICRQSGVKKIVIMGSYFAYFAKKWESMKLAERHPYIKSRLLQEEVALSYNTAKMQVMILELPYIFGTQTGRQPVWTFLVKSILDMKGITFFTKGGTTMVTINQVAQAVSGALEKGTGGKCYPIGWYNMTWKEMLQIFHKYLNLKNRSIITIPSLLYKIQAKRIMKDFKRRGIESGLDMVAFTELQTSKTYIDKAVIQNELGVLDDDIDKAIGDSVSLCLKSLKSKTKLLKMKAE